MDGGEASMGVRRGAWPAAALWTRPAARPVRPVKGPDAVLASGSARAVLRGLSVRPGATPADLVAWTGRSRNTVDLALRRLRDAGLARGPHGAPPCWWSSAGPSLPAFCLRGAPLRLLEAVHQHSGATAGGLAHAAGLLPAEVSRHGSRLEVEGWLCRVHVGRHVHYLSVAPRAVGPGDPGPASGAR